MKYLNTYLISLVFILIILQLSNASCPAGQYAELARRNLRDQSTALATRNLSACNMCHPWCLTCDSFSNCLTCRSEEGIFLNSLELGSGNMTCMKCPAMCDTCNEESAQLNRCTRCGEGTYPIADGDYFNCGACLPGVLRCSAPNNATFMKPGYAIYNGGILKCDPTCLSCTTPAKCQICPPGQYGIRRNQLTSYCQDCNPICVLCSNLTTCKSCAQGYYFDERADNVSPKYCVKCHESCATCSNSDPCVPNPCPAGSAPAEYSGTKTQPNAQGQYDVANCVACTNNCLYCEASCKVCESGYYLSLTQTCDQCDPVCRTCSQAGKCDICAIGYYYQQGGNNCVQCDASCQSCTDGTPCQTIDCLPGTMIKIDPFIDGSCIDCAYPCATCSLNNPCETCSQPELRDSNCKCKDGLLDNGITCIKVERGFFAVQLSDGYFSLEKCAPMCRECLGDAILCTMCPDGSQPLADGSCGQNQQLDSKVECNGKNEFERDGECRPCYFYKGHCVESCNEVYRYQNEETRNCDDIDGWEWYHYLLFVILGMLIVFVLICLAMSRCKPEWFNKWNKTQQLLEEKRRLELEQQQYEQQINDNDAVQDGNQLALDNVDDSNQQI